VTSAIGARLARKSRNENPVAPRYQKVRGVSDQRGGAADVGGHHLGDQKRKGRDVQRVGEQEAHRDDEQDDREVREEGREQGGHRSQVSEDEEGTPAGELGGLDCDVVEEADLLRLADDDHHPEEEAERREVDRLDSAVLLQHAEQQDQRGREQRNLGAVQPLGRDQHQRGGEDEDREQH
jgi:hypothetical protein